MSREPSELSTAPILSEKYYDEPSVFTSENLLTRQLAAKKGCQSNRCQKFVSLELCA